MAPPGHRFAEFAAADENDEYTDDESDLYPPQDLVLRSVTLNPPRSLSSIPFLLASGMQLPGASALTTRFCADFNLYRLDFVAYLKSLANTGLHPREAYGFMHPSAFADRFLKRLNQQKFQQSAVCSFFLLGILRWKIAREVELGAKGFVVEGLEGLVRVAREFCAKVANPVAVLCFQAPGALGLGSRAPIEQLFNDKELIRVPVSRDLGETYGRLLIETIGRYGMPSSPPYSPSP